MRHRKAGLKLNRTSSHRNAMFRNMVTSLFKHERIRTTDVKAKELRRWADNLITLAKRGDLHARRQALAIVREKDVVHKLFENAGEKYSSVSGGYTRIVKLGRRRGDAAPISLVELITPEVAKKKKAKPVVKKKQVAETKVIDEGAPKDKEEAKVEEEIKEKKAAEKPTAPAKPKKTEAKKPKAKVTKANEDDTAEKTPEAKVTKAKKDDTAEKTPKAKVTKAKKEDTAEKAPKAKVTKAKKEDTESKE